MKIFRLSGLIVFLVVLIFLFIFTQLFFDKIIKFSLEKGLSVAFQRPVEIGSFQSNIFSLSFKIKKLEVADKKDPFKNLVYIGKISFKIDPEKFFAWKKYYIEDASIEEISFNTKREKPFKFEIKKEETEEKEKLEKKQEKQNFTDIIKNLELPSVKDIVKKENLKTVKVAAECKIKLEKIKEKWENFINKELPQEKENIKSIKNQIKKLEEESKQLKTPDDYINFAKKVNSLKEEINQKISKLKEIKEQFNEDLKTIQTAYKDIKNASNEDLNYLKNKYSLNLEGGLNLAGLIFGDDIKNYIDKFIHYYKILSPYLKTGEEKQTEIENKKFRLSGNYIQYKEFNPLPDVVIKNAKLSLNIFDTQINGNLLDYSDNQKIYKNPVKINFFAKKEGIFDTFNFYSVFDRTKKEAKDTFSFKITNLSIKNINTGDYLNFNNNKLDVNADIDIKDEKNIKGIIKLDFKQTHPQVLKNDKTGQILSSLLSDIKNFFIEINLYGQLNSPKFALNSNLDNILSDKLKRMFAEKVKSLNNIIEEYVKNLRESYLKEFSNYDKQMLNYKEKISSVENNYKDLLKNITDNIKIKNYQEEIKSKLKLPF
jgi:uncharacterized protein (TIGR03545 family)